MTEQEMIKSGIMSAIDHSNLNFSTNTLNNMGKFYDDRESELVEHIRQLEFKLKVAEERIINLQQSDMTHEYNNTEAARVWPQIKADIEEPFKDFISLTIIHLERIERFDLVEKAKELLNQG